ncbi:hypothetical protein QVD17_28218 [Tagetes erecta]|uniref:SHSP domain-containing protein n=1 Tax=Tagetes erecta TaxID=13708 RepID=A0AAD8KCY0_TARER|nr:hypothetical protein QVD17_28218 [Tagetes erecta]
MAFFSRLVTTATSTTLLFNNKLPLPFRSTVSFIRRGFNTHIYSAHVNYPTDNEGCRHRAHDFLSSGPDKDWDVMENNESFNFRFNMPGLDKDNVKVSVVKNLMLVIKAESEKEQRHYSTKLVMQPNLINLTKIQAEMNNGVLKIVVPKIKPDECEDVYEIEIE